MSRSRLAAAASAAWPLLQSTAAATLAWVIAKYVFGHPSPFFAPVAAVIALNTVLGERGLNAIRLLQGVVVGIVVGEVTLLVLEGGYGSLAVATFASMAVARAVGGARIVVAQAAVGAILTIAVGEAEAGFLRLVDALIGAGVALVFSQVLFSPEPVAMVRRAEATALRDLADALDQAGEALERDDDELAERAMRTLRDLRDPLAELARMREASNRAARRSAVWRAQRAPVVRESENAGHLDLVDASCLMLTRFALDTSPSERRILGPDVRQLAAAFSDLACDPGDRANRQRAADRALAVARRLAQRAAPTEARLAAAVLTMRTVVFDLMVFAGIDPEQAADAAEAGSAEFDVPTPPPAPRLPFRRSGSR